MSELTAGQVLTQVDSLLPNACTQEEKLRWLRQAAGMVVREALQPMAKHTIQLPNEMNVNTVLPAIEPYDELYRCFVEAQIHYAGGDMVRCNNALSIWNRTLAALQCQLLRDNGRTAPGRLRFF